jgi:hypothetical protein
MKIVCNDKVYVQNKDLMKTMIGSIIYKVGIPYDVISKVFTDSFVVNNDNMDEFVCFEGQDNIDFFNKLAFIVDYKRYRRMSKREITAAINETMAVVSRVSSDYNASLNKTKENSYNTLAIIQLMEHKFHDLRTILWEKQGHILIKKPDELTDANKVIIAFMRRKRNNYLK